MTEALRKKYAKVCVEVGLKLSAGDELVIAAEAESHEFVAALAEAAYAAGAKRVTPLFSSESVMRLRLENESEETLSDIPAWLIASREYAAERDAAYVSVVSGNPDAYAGLSAERVAGYNRSFRAKLKRFYDATMSNAIRWQVVAYPGKAWAQKVFPGAENAVERLSSLIEKAMRLDAPDPSAAWEAHLSELTRRLTYMNEAKFKSLHYKNSIGTDFYVELPENYVFFGGQEYSKGRPFMANMPTEEIFSAPTKGSARGTLVASMPLVRHGNVIDGFKLTFEDGKVTDYSAKKGGDVLKGILQTDEGASRLGEVALVPYDSPIQRFKTVFYNTLFDENASCHFALGKAYPCVEGAEGMTREQLSALGLNDSLEHVDFMIGTPDLEITGTTQTGEKVTFFSGGGFVGMD